ncbi:hypothetical protein MTR67_007343 [Solanum verrucosum]|uniref:Retrovirus-related Pol polyprotein from transposon TNT 1-94 n=1 Tax=Solanum verrucosum TaxID=315347 RepID=A0AAF0TEZ5_SOLVR|nr:hypothetical protein MTR67_007343 [Solanum verrucosum]
MDKVKVVTTIHFKLSIKHYPSSDGEKEVMKKVPYASVVGNLMYAVVCTRPDITHDVGNPILCGYTDSDITGDVDTQVELIATIEACKELFWMGRFLGELGCAQERYVLYCDSHTAIHLGENSTFHGQSKHIDVTYHWI